MSNAPAAYVSPDELYSELGLTGPRPYSAIKGILWFIFFAAGVAALITDLLLRFKYLPVAEPLHFNKIGMINVTLQLVSCYISGAAIGLSPPNKLLRGISVAVLIANVAFIMLLIATGPFGLSHTR